MVYRVGAAVAGLIVALFATLVTLWISESAHGGLLLAVAILATIVGYRAAMAGFRAIPGNSFLREAVNKRYNASPIPKSAQKDVGGLPLTDCASCGKEVSKNAKACPHCGEPVPQTQEIKAVKAILVLVGAAAFFWYLYGPGIGEYELKPGHVACATKDEVVRYRGAKLIGGMWGQARVLASSDCVTGPKPAKVTRLARGTRLIHHVKVDGRKLYADHDGLVKK